MTTVIALDSPVAGSIILSDAFERIVFTRQILLPLATASHLKTNFVAVNSEFALTHSAPGRGDPRNVFADATKGIGASVARQVTANNCRSFFRQVNDGIYPTLLKTIGIAL